MEDVDSAEPTSANQPQEGSLAPGSAEAAPGKSTVNAERGIKIESNGDAKPFSPEVPVNAEVIIKVFHTESLTPACKAMDCAPAVMAATDSGGAPGTSSELVWHWCFAYF